MTDIYNFGMSHLQMAIEGSITALRSLSVLEEPLGRAAEMLLRSFTTATNCSSAATAAARRTPRTWPRNFSAVSARNAGRIPPFRSRPTANS